MHCSYLLLLSDDLQTWGINFVRLGYMWSGVEPSENSYNTTYFEITNTIITELAKRGIYTLFDMHGTTDTCANNMSDFALRTSWEWREGSEWVPRVDQWALTTTLRPRGHGTRVLVPIGVSVGRSLAYDGRTRHFDVVW